MATFDDEPLAVSTEFDHPRVAKSGLDLLVSLRRDPKWRDVPMVIVTGSDTLLEDDCQSYLGAHEGVRDPDGVLGKPVDRETLLSVLDTLLNGTDAG